MFYKKNYELFDFDFITKKIVKFFYFQPNIYLVGKIEFDLP